MNANRKTLVVDARMIHASGIGTDLQNLLPYLKNDFKIILLGDPNELKRYPWATDLQVVRFIKPIYSIAEQVLLPLVVPVCDYFFSPHFNVPVFPVRAAKRVVLIHDVYHLAATIINPVYKLYARFLLQSAIKSSDKIITISEFSRSEIKKHLNVRNREIYKINLGVDHSIYNPNQSMALVQEVRSKYNLPSCFILFVGNVKPHKNLKTLILALSKLESSQFENCKLVVVGKKEGFITGDESVLELVDQLNLKDKILFTGYVETAHLPVIYHLASIFVFPSLYEGFGLPPLEAMASGCPTLVSNAASMPEVCQDASYYFDGNNPDELALALSEVLNSPDLRQSLIQKGLQLIEQYTWEETATKFREIILAH